MKLILSSFQAHWQLCAFRPTFQLLSIARRLLKEVFAHAAPVDEWAGLIIPKHAIFTYTSDSKGFRTSELFWYSKTATIYSHKKVCHNGKSLFNIIIISKVNFEEGVTCLAQMSLDIVLFAVYWFMNTHLISLISDV